MVTVQTVLDAVVRGIDQSGRLPDDTSFLTRQADPEGMDAAVTLPAVVVKEVSTVRDESRVTDLVGYITDGDGSDVGRIWQATYDLEIQIDIHTASGASPPRDLETLIPRVRRALQRYDSQMRDEVFPDGDGGGVGAITQFTFGESHPENDLTLNQSLMRQRMSAFLVFVDRVNEVEEFGPWPTIKHVITPRDGDFVGLGGDYTMEFHPNLDPQREPEFNVVETK